VMEEGVHSGLAGATVPSSFRILRHLLERIEDSGSGTLLLPELWSQPPAERRAELEELAGTMERSGAGDQNDAAVLPWALPVLPGLAPMASSVADELVRRAWHPALELTGISGVPTVELAGNVHRAATTAKLSFRLSPGVDARRAVEAISSRLLADPPYGARISLSWNEPASGWSARPTPAWLGEAVQQASAQFYGRDALSFGDGGSIPFLAMLSRMYPETEFLVTGVLGPGSNAHGPDESLHIPAAKALTSSVAHVLASLPGAANSEQT
jgi:acetylornithine deacetylase/succinyl-diaminopimelate desuccinylase-like protein